ncbi:PRC-barrel domain-containing protein [Achromobacter sp. F4_2707]|uniref:PRC-barrel domain-containing protein n=1 Tax=Achromobacter sp. F4_2707 TaxID=3114286 RepID=UPI0039C62BA4
MMKTKTLVTALTVSLPLMFGGAYAQTSTTAESGNNRAADGNAPTTNPVPEPGTGVGPDGTNAAGSGTAATANQGATGSSTTGATGHSTTGATGSSTTGTTGSSATGATSSTTTGANAPGMETRTDSSTATTEAITGWSAKDDLIGKSVFNENDEKIGDVNDLVITSDGQTMYLLVGAGGFLGMGSKDVAVPYDRFERRDDRILLSGYTKEQLKALPEVKTDR